MPATIIKTFPVSVIFSKALKIISAVIAILFLLFWIMDFGRYTSVGVDSDSRHGPYVKQRYYRTPWIGDGSFWIGTGQYSFKDYPHYKLKPFDWGGRFFQRSRLIAPRSVWNHIGFWRYRILPMPSAHPELMPRESWLAIPGWRPVLVFSFFTFFRSQKKLS
ncbi:hypothetical protein [Capsulimonas corticalis]|uniref:hypothetical protein n=1 Tax=Capsulimonas corticalis TaxID=2219043 RepID=UPI000F655E64|nr:hypothetical protein [Capsulimonas corticalis]